MDIRTVNNIDIRKFHIYLKEKLKLGNKTIKHYMDELKMFLNFFKDDIKKFPEFPSIRVQQPVIIRLTEKEMEEIYEFIHQKIYLSSLFLSTLELGQMKQEVSKNLI